MRLISRRKGLAARAIAVSLACALVGAPALAASKAALGGKIVSAAGTPVRGAKVLVLRPGSDSVLFSATSGENGLYVIDGLKAGTYHVRVEPGVPELRGDTVKAEITDKGLVVNWRLSAEKPVALAIPGQVGGAESELCSPVQIGEYDVNRCYLVGGVALVGLGAGLAAGLSGGGDGEGGGSPTPTGSAAPPTATVTGTRPTTIVPSNTPTPETPSVVPTNTATPRPTTAAPTDTATPETPSPTTVAPTDTPTPETPTEAPTDTPTPETPTEAPTDTPTPETPTVAPTDTPSEEPTPTPTEESPDR
ncbi:MAG: carboxypeptidase regulatory-like domain-containing protein [Deltaproteobacteria bacterium]|nr:carboxypeptidase regulatory-like domain-containing protein [Deltaproteobacteria bacterium]